MKCEKCPYLPERSEAGDYPDCYASEEDQREFKDGSYGCRFTRKQLDRMDEEYSEYLGAMGDDMGIAGDFKAKGWDLDKLIRNMKHMIGMYPEGCRKAYTRYGTKFYKPYRNYWAGENKYLDYLSGVLGLVKKTEPKKTGGMPYYSLTRQGLNFLGRHIHVNIKNPEE